MTLVTGAAGFIGYHVAQRLLDEGERVVGIDNLNPYYSPDLKRARLRKLHLSPRFEFLRIDIADRQAVEELFARTRFETVIHLAAQAGVRYSVDYPHVYASTNLTGFLHIIEGVRQSQVGHLIYASSSSVYGDSGAVPFKVEQVTDAPVSLYAATKKANELMAHSYSHLFGIRATGLRFFTVYGPWGRPDMAPMKFTRAILNGEEIEVYGYGRMQRDFTYVADVAEGVVRTARRPAEGHRVFNVGFGSPVSLLDFIGELERALGQRARKRFLPLQPGDVVATHADSEDFWRMAGFRPRTPIETGVARLVEWYREHFRINQRVEAMRAQSSQAHAARAYSAPRR
ncbi:MAG TPA: SDR family NAD(P)-dependent oxidoreductase [Bryobacteraceae bacterium]|jgi:UDP-glucuronate 4-epimerase|nr:SDR family NAD(P)-dependent oxidoreductase [Bryobacteraceae bacterium]